MMLHSIGPIGSVHKFKPSCQKKFQIEKKHNKKTQTDLKLFLANGFIFVYAVAAFYLNSKIIRPHCEVF